MSPRGLALALRVAVGPVSPVALPVLTMGAGWRWLYLEQQGGGAADRAVVTVYPLPMYPVG